MNDPIMNPAIYTPTMEQEFTLVKMGKSLDNIKVVDKDKMIMDAMRLIMVKDNMIKALIKKIV